MHLFRKLSESRSVTSKRLNATLAQQDAKPFPVVRTNMDVIRNLNRIPVKTSVDYRNSINALKSYKANSVSQCEAIIKMAQENNVELDSALYISIVSFLAKNEDNKWDNDLDLLLERSFNKHMNSEESLALIRILESGQKSRTTSLPESALMKYLQQGHSKKVFFSEPLLLSCLQCMSRRKDGKSAQIIFEILKAQNIEPSQKWYELMIQANSYDQYNAQLWFEEYQRSKLDQNALVYVEFAKTLILSKQVPAALDLLMKLLPDAGFTAKSIHYNRILIELIKTDQLEDAEELYEMMTDEKPICQSDKFTHSLAITIYSLLNQFDKALEIYEKAPFINLFDQPYLRLGYFGVLCVRNNRLDIAEKIFRENASYLPLAVLLLKNKMKAHIDVYKEFKICFESLRSSTAGRNQVYRNKMDYLVLTLFKNADFVPLLKYAKLMHSDNYFFDRRLLWKSFETCKDQKEKIDLIGFYLLFEACFAETPEGEGISKYSARIERLLELMEKNEIKPDLFLYKSALNNLRSAKDVYGAYWWQMKMLEKDLITKDQLDIEEPLPPLIKFGLVEEYSKKGDLRKALTVFDDVVLEKVKILRSTIVCLVNLCEKKKDYQSLNRIFDEALANLEYNKSEISGDRYEDKKLFLYETIFAAIYRMRIPYNSGQFMLKYMKEYKKVPASYDTVIKLLMYYHTKPNLILLQELLESRQSFDLGYQNLAILEYAKETKARNEQRKLTRKMNEANERIEFYEKQIKIKKLPAEHFPLIFDAYGQKKQSEKLLECFGEYLDSSPTIEGINKLLQVFISLNDVESLEKVFKVMKSYVEPNQATLTIMLYAYTLLQVDMVKAVKIFHQMDQELILPEHYGFMVSGYATKDDFTEIWKLFNKIENVKLEKGTYHVLIQQAMKNGDSKSVERFMNAREKFYNQ